MELVKTIFDVNMFNDTLKEFNIGKEQTSCEHVIVRFVGVVCGHALDV